MKNGEKKNIIIYTADNFYLVNANGYMSGEFELKLRINGNEKTIQLLTEEIKNVNTTTKGYNLLFETHWTKRRRVNRSNVSSEGQRGLSKSNDRLDSGQPDSRQLSSDRTDNKDSQAKKRYPPNGLYMPL